MRLFTTIAGLHCYLDLHRHSQYPLPEPTIYESSPIGATPEVGLVPTMGALHLGHLSLIQHARRENKLVVVSIFVNPLQFGPTEDLQRYPRTLEQDQSLCEQAGVDVIFAPTAQELGIQTAQPKQQATPQALDPLDSTLLTQVLPPEFMMAGLCGRSRLGHFQGVATIVTKLLNIVQPNRAYFGQKDAQQLAIIRQFVSDLNIPVEVVACPIVRESSGLAYSSRNQYLTDQQREQATVLYRGLRQAEELFQAGERHSHELIGVVKSKLATVPTIVPEYVELVHPSTLAALEKIKDVGLLAVAAKIGSTRLIDNVLLCSRKPIVAIDGPAGAGKSTVARRVAQALNLVYLDTGAMYRALTWLVLRSGITLEDEPAIAELVSQCRITVGGNPSAISVYIDGQDITQEIRSLEVTSTVSAIAAQPAVRSELVRQQRRYGQGGGIVVEGRDIGTYVFPEAELKIYLTASVQERARRRQQDLKNQGQGEISLDALEQAICERDRKDSTRALAPLRKASDAIEVQTDGLTIPEVVDWIVRLYAERATPKARV